MKRTAQAWQVSEKVSFIGLAISAAGLTASIAAILAGGGSGASGVLDIFTMVMSIAGCIGLLMMIIPSMKVVRNELEPKFDEIGKAVQSPDRLLYGLVTTALFVLSFFVFTKCEEGLTAGNVLMLVGTLLLIVAVPFAFALYFAYRYKLSLWEGFSLALYKLLSGGIGIYIIITVLIFIAFFTILDALCDSYEFDRAKLDYLRRHGWWMY
ncbi:MAG: hypothetical protein J6K17_11485 [Oscillospiraceae bacterium]|nr:hypothetical protein [Oscillospiraceae bacterium]